MNIESFFKKIGSKIVLNVETLKNNREVRLRSPAFQKELLESRKQFVNNLTNTARHSWNATLQLLLTAHIKSGLFAFQGIFDSKIKAEDMVNKYIAECSNGVIEAIQALKSAGDTIGRGALHIGRWLLAK